MHKLIRILFILTNVLVDSACNAAGLGFNGYNELGYARWDLVTGVDIFAFEVQ